MVKKVLLILFLFFLGAFFYFAYPTVKSRYFENGFFQKQEDSTDNQKTNKNLEIFNSGINNNDNRNIQEKIDETGANPNISAKDCDNECELFKESVEDFKYCQEVCGLSATAVNDNCGSESELEKDYCLKNLAVKNNDFKLCDQIQDSEIKKTCQNRITEDIIENQ